MITLFIDTSSADVSIAILKDDNVLYQKTECIPNKHSVYTVSYIEEVIKKCGISPKDVKKIMVVNGPGSFTGLRIGVTIAKVYAYLENIDIIPISSLKMLALSCKHDYCLSLIDAHHDNYYIGLYDKDNNEVINEQFNTKDMVLDLINKYNPMIVSCDDIDIGSFNAKKQKLDIRNIYSYYKNNETVNSHLLIPNYLKLPQVLEDNK